MLLYCTEETCRCNKGKLMPYYNFKNKETGEEFEEFFTISGREEYLKDNPHDQI